MVPKLQSVLFEMKIGRKRYLVVLIQRSTIVSLIPFLKKTFWENFDPKNSKFHVLNEAQDNKILKSVNSKYRLSTYFFYYQHYWTSLLLIFNTISENVSLFPFNNDFKSLYLISSTLGWDFGFSIKLLFFERAKNIWLTFDSDFTWKLLLIKKIHSKTLLLYNFLIGSALVQISFSMTHIQYIIRLHVTANKKWG